MRTLRYKHSCPVNYIQATNLREKDRNWLNRFVRRTFLCMDVCVCAYLNDDQRQCQNHHSQMEPY